MSRRPPLLRFFPPRIRVDGVDDVVLSDVRHTPAGEVVACYEIPVDAVSEVLSGIPIAGLDSRRYRPCSTGCWAVLSSSGGHPCLWIGHSGSVLRSMAVLRSRHLPEQEYVVDPSEIHGLLREVAGRAKGGP